MDRTRDCGSRSGGSIPPEGTVMILKLLKIRNPKSEILNKPQNNYPIYNPAPLFNIICRYVALNQIIHPMVL